MRKQSRLEIVHEDVEEEEKGGVSHSDRNFEQSVANSEVEHRGGSASSSNSGTSKSICNTKVTLRTLIKMKNEEIKCELLEALSKFRDEAFYSEDFFI